MKVMVISDTHDSWENLKQAIEIANSLSCEHLIHCGDFVTPTGVPFLSEFKGKVHMVWGNNEGEKIGFLKFVDKFGNITHYGDVAEFELDGLMFFVNHYPHIAEIAANSEKYDVVCYGHDHTYADKTVKNTRLLNPGEMVGTRYGKSTAMVFDTKTLSTEQIIIKENTFKLPW